MATCGRARRHEQWWWRPWHHQHQRLVVLAVAITAFHLCDRHCRTANAFHTAVRRRDNPHLHRMAKEASNNKTTRPANNNNIKNSKNRIRRKQQQLVDVDLYSLLSEMGLQPAIADTNNSSEQKKKNKSIVDIDIKTQLDYARNGHAVLRTFLDPDLYGLPTLRSTLLEYAQEQELLAWQQKVQVAASSNNNSKSTKECTTVKECQIELEAVLGSAAASSLPFLQYFNTWRRIDHVDNLVRKDPQHRLAQAASILLDVPSVRLYQDAVFWKRRHDGPTPWHVDARMAPFDTSHMITFWIPLQAVSSNGSGLIFCSKRYVHDG
jgi:hypothetical protein